VEKTMANKTTTVQAKGTPAEVKTFTDVHRHYVMAKNDLEQRTFRKNGFDDADKMFASYIDEASWPYSSTLFDPQPYTTILEKSARLVGSKPKGRMVPREGGDALGAYINNELLSYQWDDNARLGESMISKWIMMDQGVRKYGSKFGICKWRYECRVVDGKKTVIYDGPDFVVANTRDCLPNPSYSFIKQWFQHREYVTLYDLTKVNDVARTEPVYKNLDILRLSLKEDGKGKGDQRESQTVSKNKQMKGLTDYLGQDEVFKTVEIITEYRPDRWITFAPRHGVVIRDIPNPYKHQEIPVVHLKYYPLEDDLYGVSELEPVAKQIRAINAHVSAYSDRLALKLRPPIHVNPVNVRMHTLVWNPEAKWLMNNPNQDVQLMQMNNGDDASFTTIYNTLRGSLLNALGEASQGVSQANPTQDAGRVTATEIKDTAFTRNVRDNMNQIFLSEGLKKQIMFWHAMNQQFMFSGKTEKAKVIRIVGRDAVEFFNRAGLSDIRPTQDDAMQMAMGQELTDVPAGPRFPVDLGDDMGEVAKFQPDDYGDGGNLIIEPGDLVGNYDYMPDIETMQAPSDQQIEAKLTAILTTISNPVILGMLQQEGTKPKVKELIVKMIEATKVIKDADQYFEDAPPPQPQMPGMPGEVPPDVQQNQAQPGGGNSPEAGAPTQGAGGDPRFSGGAQAMAGGQNQPFMG
jgi:hypothetical protein